MAINTEHQEANAQGAARFKKGHKKLGGRAKGVVNNNVMIIRNHLLAALEELGGVEYLVKLGREEPRTFATLLARAMPTQVNASVNNSAVVTAELDDEELQIRLKELREGLNFKTVEGVIC